MLLAIALLATQVRDTGLPGGTQFRVSPPYLYSSTGRGLGYIKVADIRDGAKLKVVEGADANWIDSAPGGSCLLVSSEGESISHRRFLPPNNFSPKKPGPKDLGKWNPGWGVHSVLNGPNGEVVLQSSRGMGPNQPPDPAYVLSNGRWKINPGAENANTGVARLPNGFSVKAHLFEDDARNDRLYFFDTRRSILPLFGKTSKTVTLPFKSPPRNTNYEGVYLGSVVQTTSNSHIGVVTFDKKPGRLILYIVSDKGKLLSKGLLPKEVDTAPMDGLGDQILVTGPSTYYTVENGRLRRHKLSPR